jgi:hypothetical protein
MARDLTLADGQLGTTAATLYSGASAPANGHRIDVILQNTGDSEETVVLTFQRMGGTARRLFQCVLQADEQLLLRGVPVQPDDTVLAVTSTASVVDYLVTVSSAATLTAEVLDSSGTNKGVTTLRKILLGVEYFVGGSLADPG